MPKSFTDLEHQASESLKWQRLAVKYGQDRGIPVDPEVTPEEFFALLEQHDHAEGMGRLVSAQRED